MRMLITTEQIQERLTELAREIGPEYRDRPLTIVGVLTGSLMFLSDFVRRLDMPLRIGLIQASSYRGKTTTAGQLHIGADLLADVRGRHVLLLDDILDTGQTLKHLVQHLRGRNLPLQRRTVHGRREIGGAKAMQHPDDAIPADVRGVAHRRAPVAVLADERILVNQLRIPGHEVTNDVEVVGPDGVHQLYSLDEPRPTRRLVAARKNQLRIGE